MRLTSNCFRCGYLKEEKRNGETVYYCNDRDCIVDPNEPDCSEEY